MTTDQTYRSLLVELFVEELPPKALRRLGDAFGTALFAALQDDNFLDDAATLTTFATPRRLAAHITEVRSESPPTQLRSKLMPAAVGLTPEGKPTPALIKKLQAVTGYHAGWDFESTARDQVIRKSDGKTDMLFYQDEASGSSIRVGLEFAIRAALEKLPIPKIMTYQLESHCELPGWDSVSFVRPVHAVIALHGTEVVPVWVLGIEAGRRTRGHRFEAAVDPIELRNADEYARRLQDDGAVIASFDERRAEIVRQLQAAAAGIGGGARPVQDDALLDEVTALVERPNVLVCEFDPAFLEVPSECLILTMKANQKYFPLLDENGALMNRFLVVSNIAPEDPSAVIQGNERVVRPRLADAKFFFDQDRRKTLASRIEGLAKVVYHNKLGTQAERSERVRAIATSIAAQLGDDALVQQADVAARLAKADLLTDMVGEFPELQGVMGGYYARHDGLPEDVASAIEDHYRPRFAGDELPRNRTGLVVALADKLETLVGMFGIGNVPTGDRDPFALRRHALGVLRLLIERQLPLALPDLVAAAAGAFGDLLGKPADSNALLLTFIHERLEGYLRELGYSAAEVDAVVAVRPRWGAIPLCLAAVRAFAQLPESPALAAANKRIGNILKKSSEQAPAEVDPSLLEEPAEQALAAAMRDVTPRADALFEAGDYTASLQTLAALREPVDAFFDAVMVNAEDEALRRNRLALLRTLHRAMNRVADLSKLAVA